MRIDFYIAMVLIGLITFIALSVHFLPSDWIEAMYLPKGFIK